MRGARETRHPVSSQPPRRGRPHGRQPLQLHLHPLPKARRDGLDFRRRHHAGRCPPRRRERRELELAISRDGTGVHRAAYTTHERIPPVDRCSATQLVGKCQDAIR